MPPFRTHLYQEWRACERFGVLPPDISPAWADNHPWNQGLMIAYNSIREFEESERDSKIIEALLSPWRS